jgi:hypothetical protein
MTETIEQAAERLAKKHCSIRVNTNTTEFQVQQLIIQGAKYQSSQPNPHRITEAHVKQLDFMCGLGQITHSRMVEILNEIAAGKHKERIEL